MDAKQKRLRPKLERRNGTRNINYYPPPPSSLLTSSFDDDGQSSSPSSLRTRSLDLYTNQTSLRVKGTDGEFELICRSLGLSGPDDFAIPTAAWEAQKARSRIRNQSSSAKPAPPEPKGDFSAEFQTRVSFSTDSAKQCSSSSAQLESRVKVSLDSVTVGPSAGIKGAQPPILTPPPLMVRPIVDNVSSTWDILNSFAPRDDAVSNSPIRRVDVSSSDEEEGAIEENEEVSAEIGKREVSEEVRLGEADCRLVSCSSRSNDNDNDNGDDDHDHDRNVILHTSSVTMVYAISPSGKFRRTITSWQKGELLGSGSFGTVYEGFTEDGFFFAVKEVSLLDQGSQGKQSIFQLEQEISLLSQFQHENIVQYLGTDKDESKLYIFLELVTKGSLASLYLKYLLRDSQVSAYTRQILNGLMYLHDRNVVHRDIKCANILVDASGSVKLADFGLAKATKLNDVKSCKGTAFWMAPEVVNLKNHGYGLAADIWSLGCTVLEMLTRQAPYSHLEGMQALFMIGKGKPPPVPDSLSRDARDFILKCVQVNPNDRPTAPQLLDHPFLRRPLHNSVGPASPHYNRMRS